MLRSGSQNLRIRIIVFMIIMVLGAPMVFVRPETASAAVKKPAKPVITYCKAKNASVTLKWKKAKSAKAYRVYVQTGKSKWKYWKKVRKTSKNKKKYSNTLKYKLVRSGKKYRVYKQQNPYKVAAKIVRKRTYTYKGKYNTTYHFALRAINGKKLSTASAVKSVRTPKPAQSADPKEPAKAEYTITYELNGGENNAGNPLTYREGDELTLLDPTRDNYSFRGWFTDATFNNRITNITKDTKGDLTLYAKWYLSALNINGTGMDNMIWNWWYYPQVVSAGDKVFWACATNEGYCGVAEYDRTTGTTLKTMLKRSDKVDDHNGAALLLLKDQRILCSYAGGHNADNQIYIRVSDAPMDIRSFRTEIVLEAAGKTSYSQIIESSGKYYLFYRVNNSKWVYRVSADGLDWSDEVMLVEAPMQYYCKCINTTEEGLIRILMYSNPSEAAPEIRMGFLDTESGNICNADARTVLGTERISYDSFTSIIDPPEGKTQRLFDAAVTAPDKPRILYATFTKQKEANDSVYFLHDAGKSLEICKGGVPLMDPKYQLGAAFIGKHEIAAARNKSSTDYIGIYEYDGAKVSLKKNIFSHYVTEGSRAARPIADVNGKAFLWHVGYYNIAKYTDFRTSASIYLTNQGEGIKRTAAQTAANVETVKAYAERLYQENTRSDYTSGNFIWDKRQAGKTNWLYYTGCMMEAFLHTDFEKYSQEVKEYYKQHIVTDAEGKVKILHYPIGELDAALPGAAMLDLLGSDALTEEERASFEAAANYIYHQLETQTIYPQAGNLWLHSQNKDGTPRKAWTKWNICLDGVYMSQLFLIHLAEAIDAGRVEITGSDGVIVTSEQLWNDIYSRMTFIMENLRDPDSGLLNHGYCVEQNITNEAVWSRGMGWFSMALVEAAEKMPSAEKRAVLTQYFEELMRGVIAWQDSSTSLWYNVTDGREEYTDNRTESSGSAMFAYCLLRGYQHGLLNDEAFRTAGLNAFNALVETKMTEEGLTDIYSSSSVTSNKNSYQVNGFVTNEAKGVAPLILAAHYAY